MEDPVAEIPQIIHTLTQSAPSIQRATLEKYFTPTASFTHPFCRTGSFNGSRWLIWCIYRWYKILSPRIELEVDSVAYDSRSRTLYVTLHQIFRLWALPVLAARVSLVTVLHLVPATPHRPSYPASKDPPKYLIKSQNDLYQVNEFVKFVSPFGILSALLLVLQLFATGLCVLGAAVGWPITWVEENVLGGNKEKSLGEVVAGE